VADSPTLQELEAAARGDPIPPSQDELVSWMEAVSRSPQPQVQAAPLDLRSMRAPDQQMPATMMAITSSGGTVTQPVRDQTTPDAGEAPTSQPAAQNEWSEKDYYLNTVPDHLRRIVPEGGEPTFRRNWGDPDTVARTLLNESVERSRKSSGHFPVPSTPFISSMVRVVEAVELANASRAIHDDPLGASQRSYDLVGDWIAQMERDENKGWLGKAVDIAMEIPAFGIEFALTSPAYSATRKGVEVAAVKTAGKVIGERALDRLGMGVASRAIGAVAQTALNPHMVAESATRNMLPEIGVSEDEAGRLAYSVADTGDGFVESLPRGFLDAFIEIASERTGGLLRFVPVPSWASALKANIARRWFGMNPGSKIDDFYRALANRTQWHGMFGEVMEERVSDIAKSSTGIQDWDQAKPSLEQLAAETVAFALPGALAVSARMVTEDLPVRMVKKSLLTADGAAHFAQQAPEAAADIVRSLDEKGSVPSRGGFEVISPRDSEVKWSAAERKKFGELLKESVNAQGIRENAGQVQAGGDVGPGGQAQGGANLEQQAQEKPSDSQEAPLADPVEQAQQAPLREAEEMNKPPGLVDLPDPETEAPNLSEIGTQIDQWQGELNADAVKLQADIANLRAEISTAAQDVGRLSKSPRYGTKSKGLDAAIQVYIDMRQYPQAYDEFYNQLPDDKKKIVDRAISLSPAETQLAERIIEMEQSTGEQAKAAGVVNSLIEFHTSHIWKQPKKPGSRASGAKFMLKTPFARQRTLSGGLLEGWAKGYELGVEGATGSYTASRRHVEQVIADREMIKSSARAGLIKSSPPRGQEDEWAEIWHPNFTKWEHAASVPLDKGGTVEAGGWVVAPDRGNFGKVVGITGDKAVVRFTNPQTKATATLVFDVNELTPTAKIEDGKTIGGRNFFITSDGEAFEKRALWAPRPLADSLNRILGHSLISDLPGIGSLTRWNAILKHNILTLSLFHHQAIARSYLLGGRVGWYAANPIGALWRGYTEGRDLVRACDPLYMELARTGLTIGLIQDYDTVAASDQTWIGKQIDKIPGAKSVKAELMAFRDQQTHFLFNQWMPYLKAHAAILEYRALLQKHEAAIQRGETSREEIARIVSGLMNDDFGGLHHGMMRPIGKPNERGRDPTMQHLFRLAFLAPDWTESNVRSMVGAFRAGVGGEVYRRFWARIAARFILAHTAFNMLFAAFDDDTYAERMKKAWDAGNFRWLAVDWTPLYRVLGGDPGKRAYFSLLGHFTDPIKFVGRDKPGGVDVPDPHYSLLTAVKHKGSPIVRLISDYLTGTNWAGRRFTTAPELLGLDNKGQYKTTRLGHYVKGQAKGGRLRGQLTTYPENPTEGGLGTDQIPSFILSVIRSNLPIPAQEMIAYACGETDGWNGLLRAAGIMNATVSEEYIKKNAAK
jgi:hypothetical protein